jgi:hypothetical protein
MLFACVGVIIKAAMRGALTGVVDRYQSRVIRLVVAVTIKLGLAPRQPSGRGM